MKATLQHELSGLLGHENVTTDYIERVLYSHDVAVLPKLIISNYRVLPDMVVRPKTAGQVGILQRFAHNNSIPVVPRGNATTVLGGAVPVLGGIVLDVSALNQVLNFDQERMVIKVEAGITCEALLKFLGKRGFTLYTYPTSAPSATVGGWLSAAGRGGGKAGLGIGSLRYGYAADSVEDLEVVLPNGELINSVILSKFHLREFIGTDGILGVITNATLKIRPLPFVQKPISFSFQDMHSLCQVVSQSASLRPVFAVFEDVNLLEAKVKGGLHVPKASHMLTFVLDGSEAEVSCDENSLRGLAISHGGQDLGPEVAKEEWEDRYYSMRSKQSGPSILGGEFVVPLTQLKPTVERIDLLAKKRRITIGVRGVPVAREVLLMAQVLCDERRTFKYLTLMSLADDLNKLGFSMGGVPYGIGLFNAFFAKEVHGAGFSQLATLKQKLDPNSVMNPGKGIYHMNRFGIPVPKVVYILVMNVLGWLSRFG